MPPWVSAEARAGDVNANPPDRFVDSATVVASGEPTTREIPTSAGQPASNRRMALLLQDIYQRADPMRNQFRCTEQVFLLRRELASGPARDRIQELQYTLAKQLLQSGLPEEALEEFKKLERMARESGAPLDARKESLLATSKALCHLRLAEQENCLLDHNADSCLFPIAGGGVHRLQRGSRAAMAELTALLDRAPGDLRARWLLNIAHMTVGEYPEGVPPLWLIDPSRLASGYDIGRFPDVAGHVGLAVNSLAGGVVLDDFDGDELIDVMTTAWGFTASNQMRVFRNEGDGTFVERTIEAGLLGYVGGLNILQGDYDNDGFLDVLVLRGAWLSAEGHYPLSLLRNNGDFTFTDVTEAAGLLRFHPTQAAAWFDFDGDGRLDIFVANESTRGDSNPCELFRNNGDGTFTECAAASGVAFTAFFKGVVSDDFNNDGRPDLYLSRRDGLNLLLRNDGPAGPAASWKFTDVAPQLGVGEPRASFSCWMWDYNNDGWNDIVATGYWIEDVGDVAADVIGLPSRGARTRLYRNNGDGTFADASLQADVHHVLHAMSANFGDLDNDGWLDFYLGTGDPDLATIIPNRMFRNDRGRRFQDVTTSGGFGQLQKGHGIAFADIDNDGDQDIYSVVGGAVEADYYPNQLFANPGRGAHWLKLRLEGVRTNRAAIGARVRVVVDEGGSERVIHRTIGSGASFGASTLRAEIGLGAAREVRRVEIFWPATGETEVFSGLEADRAFHLREGSGRAVPVDFATFQLPLTGDLHGTGRAHGGRRPPMEWCEPLPAR
ncbi:MAG: CRTAC1 family protein [Opitutaceae bacterium]|nr:CRTAC1 family protein [Opitutaceae bacterium]